VVAQSTIGHGLDISMDWIGLDWIGLELRSRSAPFVMLFSMTNVATVVKETMECKALLDVLSFTDILHI